MLLVADNIVSEEEQAPGRGMQMELLPNESEQK